MRFTCEKSMLVQGLNIAGRAVAAKSSLSVIEGILCRAGHNLSLTGYNMETAITFDIEAEVTDPGHCILPAKLFGDIIRRLPEGPVTVVVSEDFKVSIRSATPPSPFPPNLPRITPTCRTSTPAVPSGSPRPS